MRRDEESRACLNGECVENNQSSNPKKIVEATEKWVQVRVSVNSAAAGHVVFDGMFQRVNFEGKIAPKKFVSATGKEIVDFV